MNVSRYWHIGTLAHWLIAFAALALGVFAALGSSEWLAFSGIALAILLAAFTLPFTLAAPMLAVFAAAQFYFPLPDTTFTLRGALLFVVALAVRAMLNPNGLERLRGVSQTQYPLKRRIRVWMIPAALYLFAALIAALDATNRYAALKGIYDWLAIFLTAFVASEMIASQKTLTCVARALIAVGIAHALLGLAQAAFSVDQVVAVLQLPVNDFFFQPDLLRERLDSLAFNWILPDRVAPFGNFINAIDYAIFLAAIVPLAIAVILSAREKSLREKIILCIGISAIIAAIVLTLKASGIFALGAAIATLGIFILPRLSARARVVIIVLAFSALVLAVPFANAISERGSFLIARELGANTATGRLAVWTQLIAALPQRALFGFGLNNAFDLIAPTPTLNGGAFAFTQPAPESGYVAALIETGLIGFSALMSLFTLTLARASRNAREFQNPIHIGILAAIVALLIGNVTVAGFTADQNGMMLGMLMGIVVRDWTRSVEIGD